MDELGVTEVTLIGGEAYLRDDYLQIAEAIVSRGMACSITTGGRGITRERAQDLARVGVGTASVSLDGNETTHDRMRDLRGSYRSALAAIDHLRNAGLRLAVNTQVNRLTLDALDELFEDLVAHGIKRWHPIMTVPMGRAADEPDLVLQPYELLSVFPVLASIKTRADAAGILFIPSNNIGYFGPFEHILRGNFRSGYGGSCGAGKVSMGIEADGSIKGCPGLPSDAYIGGNIREHRLREIWERGKPLRYTRDRTLDDLWGFCRSCYYAEECMGGCTWTSHVFFGRPGNNPYCHHRALELAREGKRERLVHQTQAEGRPFDHGAFSIVVEACEPSTNPQLPNTALAAQEKEP
jgi:radical SAM protein with 4Fe4S-binding SPASM domain